MTPGAQSVTSATHVIRPTNVSSSNSRKRRREEADERLCITVEWMATAIENMGTDNTVRYAKDLMKELEKLEDVYPECVLRSVHSHLFVNKIQGARFISYKRSHRINMMNELIELLGLRNQIGNSSFSNQSGNNVCFDNHPDNTSGFGNLPCDTCGFGNPSGYTGTSST